MAKPANRTSAEPPLLDADIDELKAPSMLPPGGKGREQKMDEAPDATTPASTMASGSALHDAYKHARGESHVSESSSAATGLSATAAPFVPSASKKPATTPSPFEMRQLPARGYGLVATRDIAMGTRIICEKALLRVTTNKLSEGYTQYNKLTAANKRVFDDLVSFDTPLIDFKGAALMDIVLLQRRTYPCIEDRDRFVQDAARIMRIVSTNCFPIDNGNSVAIFARTSRLNHSCVPNVLPAYNFQLKKLTVHAIRDIEAGEELLTNYLGQKCHLSTRSQRWEDLRNKYGFTCRCSACVDTTGLCDTRRVLLNSILWGLEAYKRGQTPGNDEFIPKDPKLALDQSLDAVQILFDLQLFGPELMKAYRMASETALLSNELHFALEYAFNERTVGSNIYGPEHDQLRKKDERCSGWIAYIQQLMQAQGMDVEATTKKVKVKMKKAGKKQRRNGDSSTR